MMSTETDKLRYWLALLHAPGVGAVKFRQLLEHYGVGEKKVEWMNRIAGRVRFNPTTLIPAPGPVMGMGVPRPAMRS